MKFVVSNGKTVVDVLQTYALRQLHSVWMIGNSINTPKANSEKTHAETLDVSIATIAICVLTPCVNLVRTTRKGHARIVPIT